MARRPKSEPSSIDTGLPFVHKAKKTDDRFDPLPTGVADARGEFGEAKRLDVNVASKRLLDRYALALVASRGDPIPALAQAFEIPEEEAQRRMIELHEHIVGAAKTHQSDADLFERYDVTQQVQVATLRTHLFSPDPKVSLKAVEMLREMDASSKTKRAGTSFESFMRIARSKAAGKALGENKLPSGKGTK